MANSPCLNCKDRHFKCHADCGRYNDYNKQLQEINKNREKQKQNDSCKFRAKYFK